MTEKWKLELIWSVKVGRIMDERTLNPKVCVSVEYLVFGRYVQNLKLCTWMLVEINWYTELPTLLFMSCRNEFVV